MAISNFRGYSSTMALEFICNNYQSMGGDQRFYTAAVALQHLYFTGRLDSTQHNAVKNMPGSKIYSYLKQIVNKKESQMFAYCQGHFETEWLIKLNKVAK